MNKCFFIFFLLLFSFGLSAQISIQPEEPLLNEAIRSARINSSNNKPFWIGTGSYANINLDSSTYHKVGIGTQYDFNLGSRKFVNHAKLHIRHIGSTGSEFNTQAGPHLLLDEGTSDRSAVVRFRQSIIEDADPIKPGIQETITPGARYWDIRGFANSDNPSPGLGDFLNFVHSGQTEPVMSLRGGSGRVGIGTENPLNKLHVAGDARIKPESGSDAILYLDALFGAIHMGFSGSAGKIINNEVSNSMLFYTDDDQFAMHLSTGKVKLGSDGTPSSTLHVDGFTKLGDNAPKIKMFEITGTLASLENTEIFEIGLPFSQTQLIGIQATADTDNFGRVPPNTTELCDCLFTIRVESNAAFLKVYNSAKSTEVFNRNFRALFTYKE